MELMGPKIAQSSVLAAFRGKYHQFISWQAIPYVSLCCSQYCHSGESDLGKSLIFPITGNPLGPGGSFRPFNVPLKRRRSRVSVSMPHAPDSMRAVGDKVAILE